MNVRKMFLGLCLMSLPGVGAADEVIKASDLPKPPIQEPSKAAQKKAHKRVEVRKNQLNQKLEQGASAQEIGKAKAQVQVDRTESNRQDYLNEVKEEPKEEKPK